MGLRLYEQPCVTKNCDTVTLCHNYCDKNCDDGLNPIYKKSISFKKEKKEERMKITFTILEITSSPNSCVLLLLQDFLRCYEKFVTSNFVPF